MRIRHQLGAVFLAAVLLVPATARPSDARVRTGVIAYEGGGCDWIAVSHSGGFVLAEQYSYPLMSIGDPVTGEMDRFGFKDWTVGRSGRRLRVWIDDYQVSASDVIEKLAEEGCDLSILRQPAPVPRTPVITAPAGTIPAPSPVGPIVTRLPVSTAPTSGVGASPAPPSAAQVDLANSLAPIGGVPATQQFDGRTWYLREIFNAVRPNDKLGVYASADGYCIFWSSWATVVGPDRCDRISAEALHQIDLRRPR